MLKREATILRAGALIVLAILAAACPRSLHAQNFFTGPAGGDYATAGNWSGNRVPGDGNNDQMWIGSGNTRSAVYSAAASYTTTSRFVIGIASAGNGSLTMKDNAGTLTFGGNDRTVANYVGVDGGTGTLNVEAGTLATTSGAWLRIGSNAANSSGTVNLSGSGAINVASTVLIGANASSNEGIVNISGQGHLTAELVRLGSRITSGSGTSGTGGTGTLSISGNGQLTTTGSSPRVFIGDGASGAPTATFTLADSGQVHSAHDFIVGYTSSGTGSQSGGAINVAAAGSFFVGAFAAGTHTQTGGSVVIDPGSPSGLRLGHGSGGNGTYNLNGGVLELAKLSIGSGQFNMGGGTLRAGDALNTSVPIQLTTGTSVIDTNGHAVSLGGVLSGSGSLRKTGSGTLTLSGANTYTGTTLVQGGTLEVASGGSLIGTSRINALNGGELIVSGTVTVGNNGQFAIGTGEASTGTVTVASGGTLNIGNGSGGTVGFTGIGGRFESGGSAGHGILNVYGTVNVAAGGTGGDGLDGTRFWLNPYQRGGSATINLNSGGVLSAARPISHGGAGGPGSSNFYFDGGTLRAAGDIILLMTQTDPIIGHIKAGGAFVDTDGYNATIQAPMHDDGAAGSFTKLGAGTLTLTGANTYTGPTVVEAGTLEFSGGGRTNAAGTITVEDGGVLRLSRNDTWGNHATDATPVITIDTGGVVESNNSFNAIIGLTLNGGTLRANGGANANYPTFGLRGTVMVNPTVGGSFISTTGAGNHNTVAIGDIPVGSTTTFNVADGAAAADLTVSAPLSNLTGQARGLIKTGAGTMLFTGNNTYTGTTTISDGILQVGDGGTTGTLGGGAVTNNGSLVFNRSDNATVGNVISGTGDVTQLGGGTLTLTGASTFTGNIVVNDGTLVTNVAANNANPTATGLGNMTVANRTVMVESGATLTFNASDALGSYRYKTPVTMVADGGTIQNGAGRFLAIGDIELKNGGTLNTQNGANAAYQTFNLRGSISVSGTSGSFITTTGSSLNGIHLGGSTIPATTFHVASTGDPTADLTVSVPLLNEVHTTTGGLIKAGPGTMLLTAANAYTGGTTVAAGTLHVTGSLARNGSADVRVASAGDAFGSGAPAIVRRVAPAGSFAGFGSQIDGAGTLATTADLRAGTNQGGGPLDVGMAWRTVSAAEMAAFPPRTDMLSDVLKLNGMDEAGDGRTDPFVLEMSYDPSLVQPYHDPIFLAWLDGDGEWVNAVGGNAELGGLAEAEFAGSWSDFTAATGLNPLTDLPDYLGSWGIDTAGATAWAVLNHNSQFAVLAIPEPGAWLLLLSALACGLLVRRRR